MYSQFIYVSIMYLRHFTALNMWVTDVTCHKCCANCGGPSSQLVSPKTFPNFHYLK